MSTSTQIMFAVSGHWLLGSLELHGTRIREEMNNPGSDFVTLRNVEVHPHAQRECVAELPSLVIDKSKVELIVPPTDKHEAPQKALNNRVIREEVSAFAIVGENRVQGTLHLPSNVADTHRAILHQTGRFFALTQASLGYGDRSVKQLDVPLLLVNKEFVSCLETGAGLDSESAKALEQESPRTQGDEDADENLAALLQNVRGLLAEADSRSEQPAS